MTWHTEKAIERFWAKVDRSAGEDSCWPWTASVGTSGYGRFKARGTNQNASRVALEIALGKPLFEKQANHICDNPLCCNPAHLYLGTQSENMLDRHDPSRTRFTEPESASQADKIYVKNQ